MTPASKLRSVALFEAKCGACRQVFGAPSLGDFAYGQFLLFGERGSAYAYLDAIDHPVWMLIAAEIPPSNGDQILRITAALADRVQEQAFVPDQVCPECCSSQWESWEGKRVGDIEIGDATFVAFHSLSDRVRRRRIRSLAGLP